MKTLLPYLHKLDHEFPKEVRLEVYKKAIEIIEKCETHDYYDLGKNCNLCLLLPCITWNLKDHLDDPTINGEHYSFDYTVTIKSFTELNKEIINEIERCFFYNKKNEIRLEYLNKWVAQLEKEIK